MSSTIPELSPQVLIDLKDQARRSGCSLQAAIEKHFDIGGQLAMSLLGARLGLPVLGASDLLGFVPHFECLGYANARGQNAVVLKRIAEQEGGSEFYLAVADPFDLELQARVLPSIPGSVHLALIHPTELGMFLTEQEHALRAVDEFVGSERVCEEEDAEVTLLDLASIGKEEGAAVRTVNSTLFDALKTGASDIHFEAAAGGMAVKYRVDGVLLPATQVASKLLVEQVVSRIKVLADLDISERRTPQDGKFRINTSGHRVDIRVSIMPSVFGEDAVLRILDRRALSQRFTSLRLDDLGFLERDIETIRELSRKPYGMLLVTGPTGSGKTTTLYAAISEINTGRDKIVTIEDPVEYHLDGVLQIPVNEKKGLSFARGLRSILRHDPDKILVGEIRDTETAQIAVQSALTGHAVFTTVHANNALDVVGRVVNMSVDTYGFLSALNGIVGQRLIRKICTHCAEPDLILMEKMAALGAQGHYRRAPGCADCRGTGYRGRRAIAEVVVLDDELRTAIFRQLSPAEVKQMLQLRGVIFLREQALALAMQGETTLEEVDRVTLAA